MRKLLFLLVAACSSVPVERIERDVNAAAPGFTFLPPLDKDPAVGGTFDGTQQTAVVIAKVSADGLSTTPIASIGKGLGDTGLDPITVNPVAQQYSTHWHTGDADLDLGARYRITIWSGDKLLGTADVSPTTVPGRMKKIASGEYMPLELGSVLPIKWWLDRSATAAPIGVNMPDLLWAYLAIPIAPTDAAGARQIMDDAVAAGINQVRFVASPYWPLHMVTGKGWGADPQAFFAAFDQLVADAGARRLRLVPSLLWNIDLFPDVAGEPIGRLFVPGSLSRTMAEEYIRQVVSRYSGNPTILFWEIGNEINLLADLDRTCIVSPDGSCDPKTCSIAPQYGTPACRTAADNYFSCNGCRGVSSAQQDLREFSQSIATLIHAIDADTPVSSGNSHPRPAAWHLSRSPCPACDYTADTEDQYLDALANLHPPAVDVVSVHHYPEPPRFGDNFAGLHLLELANQGARDLGKTLFVGELGEELAATITCNGDTTVCHGNPAKVFTQWVLDKLVMEDIRHSALWAWEFYQFCPATPTCFNIERTDAVTQVIANHNRAYDACTGLPNGAVCPIGHCASGICSPL